MCWQIYNYIDDSNTPNVDDNICKIIRNFIHPGELDVINYYDNMT